MDIEAGLSRTKLVERLRQERDTAVLGAFTGHRAWQVRWEAINSLGDTDSPDAERYLLQVIASSDDAGDLTNASAALGRVGSQAAIPALSGLIHHSVEDVKSSAIQALGLLGDASLTPLYIDALSDRSWVAKWAAMAAIHRNGDERAIGPVVERLHTGLSRERRTNLGGWTEVMYAIDFLARWRSVDQSAGEAIDWVRSSRMDRLQPHERDWFESTFGPITRVD
jgi:HEAT repeat protein